MSVFLQDCKKFQGELFGICNLFRDLSDKHFTREIIELHGKQGQHLGTRHEPAGTCSTSLRERVTLSSSPDDIQHKSSRSRDTNQEVPEDMGMFTC